ncbi:MAG: AzlD domain-containing protein [Candidatus Latescibacteria bacterium]|nr:AzlD domain-containing protein [Candidatus Latescibacterota bacterium]
MENELTVTITIIAMAVATYATRAGGLWLLERFTPTPFVSACLSHLPGTLLISIAAPLVTDGGPAEWTAAFVTILIMGRTSNLLAAMTAGVMTVALLRTIVGAV